jgi:hypothetical protein
MMDIGHIARSLGGDVISRDSCNVPGPNHSRRDRSLSIRIDRDGRLKIHSFANDDWKECRAYVFSKLGISDDWKPDNKPAVDNTGDDDARRKKFALAIWNDSIDPRGTLVEKYLREHRGLTLPDDVANSVIRFHHGLRYTQKNASVAVYLPTMVCLLRDIKSDEPVGIIRTFVNRYTGAKIDRRMLGIAKGAAVKLDASPANSLTIGEGVETALSTRAAGNTPAWALGSAGPISAFPKLRKVRELTILLENDNTSHKAVSICMNRYRSAGRTVRIIRSLIGSDYNDAWKAVQDGHL